MSKKLKRTTEATKLLDHLTGADQLLQGEETFEQIKETNLTALEDLRRSALQQLHESAKLGLCVKDPSIVNSAHAARAGQLVVTLTKDVTAMKAELQTIKERQDVLAGVTDVVDFIPLALELGEEHQLWQSKFETGVLPVLEEIKTLIETTSEPKKEVTDVAE
jgi:hypothetical protein